jgi:single-stranded DNA-binding protein
MVSVHLSGKLISEVRTKTRTGGAECAQFTVESDDQDRSSLPLRFEIIAFGVQAERAATFLKTGTPVNLFGRMSAGGDSKKVTVQLSVFEIQQGAPADA